MGDLGERFGFEILNHAFRMVMDGAELVALQKNRFWLTADGLSLDAGPFVAAIEYASGRDALVVGKPSQAFFASCSPTSASAPEDAAIVGDDVETDVGGAMNAGLAGFLVRTGKYREEFVRESGIEPTATIDSIADAAGPARGLSAMAGEVGRSASVRGRARRPGAGGRGARPQTAQGRGRRSCCCTR